MKLLAAVALLTLPALAAAQPLIASEPSGAALEALAAEPAMEADAPARVRVAFAAQREDDGCGSSSSGSSGGQCEGDDGCNTAVALTCIGGAVLVGGIVYWLVSRRDRPRRDSLSASGLIPDAFSPGAAAFAEALREHIDLVAPADADVLLTVREEGPRGLGVQRAPRHLVVSGTDRTGLPLALDRGALPSARLTVDPAGDLAGAAQSVAEGLRRVVTER